MNKKDLKHKECVECIGEGFCRAKVLQYPTIDFCNNQCPANTTLPDRMFVVGIDYSKKPTRFQMVVSYLKAEASMIVAGQVNDRIFKNRMKTCRSCEHLEKSYDEVGHCGACGCGLNSRAALTVKGKMPSAECVKGKWKK